MTVSVCSGCGDAVGIIETQPPHRRRPQSFPAKHPAKCPMCHKRIPQGAPARVYGKRWTRNGSRVVIAHASCIERYDPLR